MRALIKVIRTLCTIVFCLSFLIGAVVGISYLLGIRPAIAMSGSMEPVVHTGSVIMINEKYSYDDVKVNDVIAFELNGGLMCHRAIELTDEGIATKGDANENEDGITTTRENFRGKLVYQIPELGKAVVKFKSKEGLIFICAAYATLVVIDSALGNAEKKLEEKKKAKEAAA